MIVSLKHRSDVAIASEPGYDNKCCTLTVGYCAVLFPLFSVHDFIAMFCNNQLLENGYAWYYRANTEL